MTGPVSRMMPLKNFCQFNYSADIGQLIRSDVQSAEINSIFESEGNLRIEKLVEIISN